MLNPELQNMDMRTNIDDQASGNNKIIASETQEMQGISVDKKKTEASKTDMKVDQIKKDKKTENKDDQLKEEIIIDNPEDNITIEKREIENEPKIEVRRSQRKRNQWIDIQPDQIGECDDAKDVDYQ